LCKEVVKVDTGYEIATGILPAPLQPLYGLIRKKRKVHANIYGVRK